MKIKQLWMAIMVSMVIGCFTGLPAFASAAYPDVDVLSKEGRAIMQLTNAGVVGGYEDGTFRPNGQLTRAEFVKIVNGVFHYQESTATVTPFDDVQNHWAHLQIKIAQQQQYISGVGSIAGVGEYCFAPDAVLTREQVAVILTRILELENLFAMQVTLTDPVSDWAKNDVHLAITCGVFSLEENNTFRATMPITRAEVCVALAPYMQELDLLSLSDEKRVELALKEAQTVLGALSYDNADMNELLRILLQCINNTLHDATQGVTITREYIDTTYAEEIAEARWIYYEELTNDDRIILRPDIVNHMSLDAVSILYDYFLADRVDVELEDKLEEIERDIENYENE